MNGSVESRPRISVIATSRNDDHGGSMLRRMQAFVDGLCAQCERFSLDWELILVEWNPPPDRPSLDQALQWPPKRGPLRIRVIRVPAELHQKYAYADKMGLFQMIAKNVGARRSRGDALLFTNIDILFNDDLVRFLGQADMSGRLVYRIDRTDVRNEVPLGGGIQEMLSWAAIHQLRVHRREGSYRVSPDGQTLLDFRQGGEFRIEGGMISVPEAGRERVFMKPRAKVVARIAVKGLELKASVTDEVRVFQPLLLEARDASGTLLGDAVFADSGVLRLRHDFDIGTEIYLGLRVGSLPPGAWAANAFLVESLLALPNEDNEPSPAELLPQAGWANGWHQWEKDAQGVHFRWGGAHPSWWIRGPARWFSVEVAPGPSLFGARARASLFLDGELLGVFPLECQRTLHVPLPDGGERERILEMRFDSPALPWEPDPEKRVLAVCATPPRVDRDPGLRALTTLPARIWHDRVRPMLKSVWKPRKPSPDGVSPVPNCAADSVGYPPELTDAIAWEKEMGAGARGKSWHTNGCGDFTLLSREEFFQLGGYWEYEGFSMHLDSLLLFAAQAQGFQEVVLPEPMAIYHIEHQPGSGFTPEAADQMYERVRKKGIPWLSNEDVEAIRVGYETGKGPSNPPDWGLANQKLEEITV